LEEGLESTVAWFRGLPEYAGASPAVAAVGS
jgi:hypothetical protein